MVTRAEVRGRVVLDGRELVACGATRMGDLVAVEVVDPASIVEDEDGNIWFVDGWVVVLSVAEIAAAA